MKSLRFHSCLLVSHREKRARKIEFHPEVTVLKGPNDTGKSSVVKSLYQTLGAAPAVEHPRWKGAGVSTLLNFSVDGKPYSAFRAGRMHALFCGNELIGKYTSVSSGLGPALADLLDFKLRLPTRDGKIAVPPPAYLFLPFYCDQDKGWGSTWSSFDKLAQFPNWRKELIPYHAGLRASRYYTALEELAQANSQLAEPKAERLALISLKERQESVSSIDAEIDPELFRKEINELVARYEALSAQRQQFRQQLSALNERKIQLMAQRDILMRVKNELQADYEYSVDELSDIVVECPTCGQLHENSFAQRFAIAQDEARATDLAAEIVNELSGVLSKIREVQTEFERVSSKAADVQEILMRKRGEITFSDIVERQGVKEFNAQISRRVRDLDTLLGRLDREAQAAKEKMKAADSPDRRAKILDTYRSSMSAYLRQLQVSSLSADHYREIDFIIRETGSDRPRAILAYMFSMFQLIWSEENTSRCPILLDSPNQQDQDPANHKLMLEFIRDHRPKGSQLVLCVVDDCNIQFGGSVLTLGDRNFVLRDSDYLDISAAIRAYENLALS